MDRRQPETESKSLIERGRNKLVATGVIAALGIGALAGCSTNAKAEGPTPTETTTQTVEPTTPVETETPTPTETETAPTVELEALNAEMTPDELASEIEAISKAWLFHGGNTIEEADASLMESVERNEGLDAYHDWKAQQAADLYAPLLFGDTWKEDLQTEEASLSGAAGLFQVLNTNTEQNLINAIAKGGRGEEVPSLEYTISEVSDEVSDTLDEGERGLLYNVHYEYVNANNDDPTEDVRFGYILKEQPNGTLVIVGRAIHEIPQTD